MNFIVLTIKLKYQICMGSVYALKHQQVCKTCTEKQCFILIVCNSHVQTRFKPGTSRCREWYSTPLPLTPRCHLYCWQDSNLGPPYVESDTLSHHHLHHSATCTNKWDKKSYVILSLTVNIYLHTYFTSNTTHVNNMSFFSLYHMWKYMFCKR